MAGDRAEEYDYTDYDLYAYDDEETEKLKREHQLQQELQNILDKMNAMNTTTTETPLPTAVSLFKSVQLVSLKHFWVFWSLNFA